MSLLDYDGLKKYDVNIKNYINSSASDKNSAYYINTNTPLILQGNYGFDAVFSFLDGAYFESYTKGNSYRNIYYVNSDMNIKHIGTTSVSSYVESKLRSIGAMDDGTVICIDTQPSGSPNLLYRKFSEGKLQEPVNIPNWYSYGYNGYDMWLYRTPSGCVVTRIIPSGFEFVEIASGSMSIKKHFYSASTILVSQSYADVLYKNGVIYMAVRYSSPSNKYALHSYNLQTSEGKEIGSFTDPYGIDYPRLIWNEKTNRLLLIYGCKNYASGDNKDIFIYKDINLNGGLGNRVALRYNRSTDYFPDLFDIKTQSIIQCQNYDSTEKGYSKLRLYNVQTNLTTLVELPFKFGIVTDKILQVIDSGLVPMVTRDGEHKNIIYNLELNDIKEILSPYYQNTYGKQLKFADDLCIVSSGTSPQEYIYAIRLKE